MIWELVISICQALLIVSISKQSLFDVYPRLDKGKVGIIAANYKLNGIVKSACWIRVDPYQRKAMIQEYGVCRRICKEPKKKLKILEAIFCKKKAAIPIKYDFLVTDCSQMSRHHQLCLIQNINYDSSSDAFSVRLKLHRCQLQRTK